MKKLFSGYFTPNETEFKDLWKACVFAFDTNVLLGLYRSTPATQQVFFDILEKIADRIFLPYHAAFEYLRGRLGVISVRSDSFGKIAVEAEKLAKLIESIAQEHALRNGSELATISRNAASQIRELAEGTAEEEPDLVRDDPILEKLAKLFEKCTGEPYSHTRLAEIYSEAAQRYSKGVPPGFKDEKKPEPDRYGDVVIWFQLIDNAKSSKKPLVFITGDGKDDWWHKHRGEVLGPRPELRQEMMDRANVAFYMYTAPRFLEFAKQFLNLTFDTKSAETEFEKIEKQDKEAAERASEPERYQPQGVTYANFFPMQPSNLGHVQQTNFIPMQPSTFMQMQPTYAGYAFRPSSPFQWWENQEPDAFATWTTTPVDYKTKNKLFSLLPINGYVYQSSTGKWKCEIVNEPVSDKEEPGCYNLKFERQDVAAKPRQLKLFVSLQTLERDADWRYKTAIGRAVMEWLAGPQVSGEIACLP